MQLVYMILRALKQHCYFISYLFGAMLDTVTSLPPSKRYITTHDAQGKSIIQSAPAQKFNGHPSVGGVARSCMLHISYILNVHATTSQVKREDLAGRCSTVLCYFVLGM
jgi:hypothetical protein